jgi:transcriptional regulator with XRE-family HTH domain
MVYSPEPTSRAEVAARLKLTREALELDQAEMARMVGTTPQKWNNAETGDNFIGREDAIRLCRATGVTMDWIFRGVRVGLPAKVLEGIAKVENASGRPARRRA